MKQGLYILKNRAAKLQALIQSLQTHLANVPDGSLRLSTKSKTYRFYQHVSTSPNHPTSEDRYIPKQQFPLAQRLAQKDYDKKLYALTQTQCKILQTFLKEYDPTAAEKLYNGLHPVRKSMVDARFVPRDQFISHWLEEKYDSLGFSAAMPEIYTEKGERVRSKSEKILADFFFRQGIPYRYECPLSLSGLGTVHPDFTLLNIHTLEEFYWEHLGMMDDSEYIGKAIMKVNRYIENGYLPGRNLILSFESRNHPLNTRVVEQLAQEFLL